MGKMKRIDDYVAQLASDAEQVSDLEFSFAHLCASKAQLLLLIIILKNGESDREEAEASFNKWGDHSPSGGGTS